MRNGCPAWAVCLCCLFLLSLTAQAGNIQAAQPAPPSPLPLPAKQAKPPKFFPALPDKAAEPAPPAAKWIQPPSRQGQGENAQAGKQIMPDVPVIQNNLGTIQKSAEQGDAKAQFRLGLMYEFGIGVAENKKLAASWYSKAAKQEHGRAQEMLSKLAQTERELRKNEAEFNKPANKFMLQNEDAKPDDSSLMKTHPGHI